MGGGGKADDLGNYNLYEYRFIILPFYPILVGGQICPLVDFFE